MGDNVISIGTAILSGFGVAVVSSFTAIIVSLIKKNVLKKDNKAVKAENERLKKRLDELTDNPPEKQELEKAKTEIQQLKESLAKFTKDPLALKEGIYYDADGNVYCPACCGSPYERIPLKTYIRQGSWIRYQCPKCHEKYDTGSPPPPPPRERWDPLADD
jgi:regulator of replication initiation timing